MPWWGRLESRVITALVVLGTLCVGASFYLVTLTVEYFDGLVDDAIANSERATSLAKPFYDGYVQARKQAYQARLGAMARELEIAALRDAGAGAGAGERRRLLLAELLQREEDLVELSLRARGEERPGLTVERGAAFPEESGAWVWVPIAAAPVALSGDSAADERFELSAVFALDPAMDRRYQELGRLQREAGLVSVGDDVVTRPDLESAVFRAIGVASALVLLIAFVAGLVLARATTRKASALSRVMQRVAAGELEARVPELGNDELGQLGGAFNRMLDELAAAQEKLSYLQRVGAWQEMARRIAHEIKNPLTPIQLAVQQLREKDPKIDARFSALLSTSVEIVEDEVAALRRMVTSFSQFAKVPEARLEPVSIARVFDEFERAYGHLTERASDTLEVLRPDAAIEIAGDRQLLKQCLVNFVENAVLSGREADRETVRVRVSARVDDGVVIRVDDNGPGIEPARRERVFEPYESTRRAGTGLGLAIAKKIILDHGGEIWIDESPLGGAGVVVKLPARAAD